MKHARKMLADVHDAVKDAKSKGVEVAIIVREDGRTHVDAYTDDPQDLLDKGAEKVASGDFVW